MSGQRYSHRQSCASYGHRKMASRLLLGYVVLGSLLATAPNAAFGQAEHDAQRLLEDAMDHLASRKYDASAAKALEAEKLARESFSIQQQAGEILYRSGNTKASLPCFDRAVKLVPQLAPRNWQRGIALGSYGNFKEGAAQFKTHHDVNPDDVENSAWYFLCVAKSEGIEAARKTVIPSRGDSREPMMSVLKMLKGTIVPDAVMKAAIDNTAPESASRARAQFFADLYVGLYYDSLGDKDRAIKFLKRSQGYGVTGYMADTARVYLSDRFSDAGRKESVLRK